MSKGFLKIIKELNYPPIFLVSPHQFSMIDGEGKKDENSLSALVVGIAATGYPIITIHSTLEGKERDNTIYHELAHHLWPWRQHWWIEMFAEKMANGGGRGYYSKKYKKKRTDLPTKARLRNMARRQAEKLKERYKLPR